MDPLLRFVPAHVSPLLSGRRVPVLSSRPILGACRPAGAVALTAVLEEGASPEPVLRAARAHDAVLGLAPPGGDARDHRRFFERVAEAAEATGHGRALFLATAPLSLTAGHAEDVAGRAADLLGAGFTHLVISATDLAAGAVAEAAAPALRAAAERDLGTELRLGPGQAGAAGGVLAGLAALEVECDLLTFEGLSGADLVEAVRRVEATHAGWAETAGTRVTEGLRDAAVAGVLAVTLASPFAVRSRPGEVLAAEARAHHETAALLRLLGLNGTGERLRSRLEEAARADHRG